VARIKAWPATGFPELPAQNIFRRRLPFRSVNQPGKPGYSAGMQRHHLLPRQLLSNGNLRILFDSVGYDPIGFDDFRYNGLLLPALEQAAMVLGLPLHRGPHNRYNQVVAERVGQIESGWQAARRRSPDLAAREVLMRMHLLQRALRRSLMQPGQPCIRLNTRDPLGQGVDFSELDAMADIIWSGTMPD
jgi:hypothetical protein